MDEDINIVKIESKGGNVGLEYEYEEEIECEEGAPPCDVLSSLVYDAYISNEFDEVINEAKHAIACNCAVTHADQIYAFLARAYVELGEDNKATKSIDKGLSYSSENLELIELAVWNAKRLKNIEDEISYLELLLTIILPTSSPLSGDFLKFFIFMFALPLFIKIL